MGNKSDSAISRREFARRAAFVSAAASLAPSKFLGPESIGRTAAGAAARERA